MGIENLKRWHWIVIGLLVGAGLAYVRAQSPRWPTYTVRHGMTVTRFAEYARGLQWAEPHPALIDLVIHPPLDGKNYVTGKYLYRVFADGPIYEAFELSAPIPFVVPKRPETGGDSFLERIRARLAEAGEAAHPEAPPEPPDSNFTIRDYLAATAPQIGYRYLWWKEPAYESAVWVSGSVVVIGGIWPFIVGLLVGAGFGRKQPPEPEYDLDRFASGPEAAPAPPRAEMSEQDQARLAALEHELEHNLAATGPATDSTRMTSNDAPATIRQLSNQSLEPTMPPAGQEEHEYAGEYYPVERPRPRKSDSPPDGTAPDAGA